MFQKKAGALAVILDWEPLERNPGLVDYTGTRQASGLSLPAREGTCIDEKVLRTHKCLDKKWEIT